MKLIFGFIAMLSLSAQAQDLVKTYDGKITTCSNKADAFQSHSNLNYRPISLDQDGSKATLRLEFLRCTKKDGNYTFVRDSQPDSKQFPSYVGRDMYEKNYTKITLRVVNDSEIIDEQDIIQNKDGTYEVTFNVETSDYQRTSNGLKTLEFFLSAQTEVTNTTTGVLVYHQQESLGSYKMIVE